MRREKKEETSASSVARRRGRDRGGHMLDSDSAGADLQYLAIRRRFVIISGKHIETVPGNRVTRNSKMSGNY